jgi:hypothetical protein
VILTATRTQALWYLTRGTGLVSLVLLTISVVLGVTETVRWANARWPRFVTAALHKNVSLLVVAFLGIHIVTAVVDSFAPISWLDVVIPFTSKYRPVWLGLGALAFDLLLALTVTSLVRQRLGYAAWRAVHWTAYACWPLALVHGLGTGTDTPAGWVVVLNLACLAAVVAAVWWRVAVSADHVGRRALAGVASVVVPVGVLAWTWVGPLRSGWSRRAGTPAALLAGGPTAGQGDTRAAAVSASAPTATLPVSFTADLRGSTTQRGPDSAGTTTITIDAQLSGGATGALHLVLEGQALDTGGIQMRQSKATLGPAAQPSLYQGRISSLAGNHLVASLTDGAGHAVELSIQLQMDQSSGAVSGTVRASGGASARGG